MGLTCFFVVVTLADLVVCAVVVLLTVVVFGAVVV